VGACGNVRPVEDDRSRGRLGDATRQRIADLAPGWKVPAQPSDDEGLVAASRTRTAAGSSPAPLSSAAHADSDSDGRLDPTPGADGRAVTEPGEPGGVHRDEQGTVVLADSSADLAPILGARGVRSVRDIAALPRVPGLLGDIRYVATVVAGVPRTRRELATLEPIVVRERARRSEALIVLATAAIGDDAVSDPAVVSAREQLTVIEDRRAQHAGVTAAADEEIAAIERDHTADELRRSADIAALEAELSRVTERLAPLSRDLVAARRAAADLKAHLAHLDAKLAAAEIRAANRPRGDASASELTSLQTERVALAGTEPVLAVELDSLTPRVAALEASRDDLERLLARARAEHTDASRRAEEIVAALAARKVVENRAVADGEADRRRALEALGERLHADRPEALRFEIGAVDERDLALGQAQRRVLELREIQSSVDRGALVRGLFVLIVAAVSVVAAIVLAL